LSDKQISSVFVFIILFFLGKILIYLQLKFKIVSTLAYYIFN